MTDLPTLQSWITKLGFETITVDATTLRIRPPSGAGEVPPFFVQWTPNWVVLSILPVLARGEYRAEDLGRRLLMANRDMRLAKFALDKSRAVVLCAELPTESLDYSEIENALTRMVQYVRRFRAELLP
ncbi:MAG: CesT family type III secretion system chaperone [Minicystis sp.]